MERDLIRERAWELVEKLTLEEKLGMIHGAQLFSTKGVERLGIPPLVMSDGPMGVRQEFEPDCWRAVGNTDDMVTYLPCNSALASTWNRALSFAVGSVLGEEARGRGKDVILAPGINIKRSPLCGRNFEYFSEDPYLTGELAASYIQGVQIHDVAACVKHFAANNQETERLTMDVDVSERALRELYLPAFYQCVTKGNSLSIMGAYNRLYKEHCCQSKYLLGEILRKEWGYDGVVISDWGGVHNTMLAAESQLDIEMSVTNNFQEYFMAEPLKEKIDQGVLSEAFVDEKVVHILMLMQRLHMIESEGGKRKSGAYNTPEHRQTALQAARESVVLLKNEDACLPLCHEQIKRILLVGENAKRIHSNGGGSAEIQALYEISPLMGIHMLLGGNVTVDFVQGYESMEKGAQEECNWQERSLEHGGGFVYTGKEDTKEAQRREELRNKAVEQVLEGNYDAVIFVGGLNHEYDSEGRDRSDMKLPYEQDILIHELLKVKQDLVVVMIGGSPVEMGEWIGEARAVVWSWYAGMEGGYALAEVLFGKVNPSGRLPETFYKTHMDCSAHCVGQFGGTDTVNYREGIFVGYRYNETFGVEPQFCFGHGLSYTEFFYEGAECKRESKSLENDGGILVSCQITNSGNRAGAEVIQIYQITECEEGKIWPATEEELESLVPVKELIGFKKVYLESGETKKVEILVKDIREGSKIGVGKSVEDICLVIS